METLNLIVTVILGIISIISAVAGVYLRFSKKQKKKRDEKNRRNQVIDSLPQQISTIQSQIESLRNSNEDVREDINNLIDSHDKFENRFDEFEIKQLKYMINDSFLGYDTIHDIPTEQLHNAAECCDIYISKGLNHETGAKCKLIYEEIERRAQIKAEGETNGKITKL